MTADPVAAPVPTVWGNVPQRNKNFTGRNDVLRQLRQSLTKASADQADAAVGQAEAIMAVLPDTDSLPQALQGMGGVGKTAVAIEYAYLHRSEYQVVWWIPADQPALIRSSLAGLAAPLGLPSVGIEQSAAAVLDALRRGHPYRRWLLIFDNADQPEDLFPVIPRGPGHVLITSRNPRWNAVVQTMPLDVFSRAESTAFLVKRAPLTVDQPGASRLAEGLGDLPLALEQAGAMQAETGMSVDEYLRLLDESTAEIMAEGKALDYPHTITAAWKLSAAQLDRSAPQAMELLRCCAFFGPEPIPRDLFRRSTQATETRIRDLLSDPIELAGAIRELARFALVKIDGRGILVHRLIQALLREEIEEAERAAYRHEAHLILAAGAPKDPDNNRYWPRYAELVAHIASQITGIDECPHGSVRDLALDVVRYLYRSGDHESSRLLAERFIRKWTETSGSDDPSVLAMRRYRGDALRELGSYAEAYDLDEATLRQSRKTLGDRHPLTLTMTNSLAADLRARGEFAAARRLDTESLALHKAELGPDNPQTLRVMNNLALDHGLNSAYRQARELHRNTYILQSEARHGISYAEVLNSWNGLARAVRLCSGFAEARDVGEDAYDFGREQLGSEHYLTLRTGKDLSIAMRQTGVAYDDTRLLAREVHDLCTRLFPQRPDTMAAAISLSNVLRVLGENTEALTRDHDYALTVAVNLASDLTALGDPAAARELGEETLAKLLNLMGPDNALTLGCAANLAIDRRVVGAEAESEELLADTERRYAALLGVAHPDAIAAGEGRRIGFDFDPPPI